MSVEVFKRYEKKYIITKSLYHSIKNDLLIHTTQDVHNSCNKPYVISNIYYDTENNYLISNSLSKPAYKEKLRLRAYGTPKAEQLVYLEIKKKYQGVVSKRRTLLMLNEAYDFINAKYINTTNSYVNKQVVNEIAFLLEKHPLKPKLFLAYDRYAYVGKDNSDLRITFDEKIRTRRYNLNLESGDYGELLLDTNLMIMEVKVSDSIPVWLTNILSTHKIFSTSFSKYGCEYENLIRKKEKKGDVLYARNLIRSIKQPISNSI